MNLRGLRVYLLRFCLLDTSSPSTPIPTHLRPHLSPRRIGEAAAAASARALLLKTRDGRHGRDADEAGAAGPADAAPGAAADGAPPPRTDRPREGQFTPLLS